jgi:hypothetical protein
MCSTTYCPALGPQHFDVARALSLKEVIARDPLRQPLRLKLPQAETGAPSNLGPLAGSAAGSTGVAAADGLTIIG